MTARGPLVIMDREVYFSSGYNSDADLALIHAGNLDDLLKFDFHLKRNRIYSLKKEFIEGKAQYGFGTEEDRKKEIGNRKLFSFIVKELMPYLSGHKENIEELLGKEVEKEDIQAAPQIDEQELRKNIENTKRSLKEEQEKYGLKFGGKDGINYFLSLIRDVLVLGGNAYLLSRTEKENSDLSLNINSENCYFKLTLSSTVKRIEEYFSEFIEWTIRSEAIDEFSDFIEEMEKTRLAVMKDFEKIIQLKEFNDGDVGFLRRNSVYVYQILQPFAMLDPRPVKKGICYEFPKCRVGMAISYNADNNRIYLEEPVLFEPIWHPFVEHKEKEFQHLCGGKVLNRGKESEVEWVAKNLDDAKNVVMHGLTPDSIKRHRGDRENGGQFWYVPLDEKLKSREMKIEDAKAKGLIITNNWNWED
ncbi:hypothetical protein HZA33_04870 [Candidatus Pacearchaeota archaeon]|nr:hypothetical protein [Candidatus Pacearchaeota archaeon]